MYVCMYVCMSNVYSYFVVAGSSRYIASTHHSPPSLPSLPPSLPSLPPFPPSLPSLPPPLPPSLPPPLPPSSLPLPSLPPSLPPLPPSPPPSSSLWFVDLRLCYPIGNITRLHYEYDTSLFNGYYKTLTKTTPTPTEVNGTKEPERPEVRI